MSERRACRLVNQPRGTQRYQLTQREDEDALSGAIVELASQYGRYGYRRITALLKRDGWQVGKDRVERIWRREGLKVPQKQKSRGRLWFNDGSCVRLRPEHALSRSGNEPPSTACDLRSHQQCDCPQPTVGRNRAPLRLNDRTTRKISAIPKHRPHLEAPNNTKIATDL